MDDLDRLRPVWRSLHQHHEAIGSSPLQTDLDLAWSIRRAGYAGAMAAEDGFLLVAEADRLAVGYVAVLVRQGPDDTFPVGARWAEVYSLAVLPEWRSAGVGTRLMDAAETLLGTLGIADILVAAMVENEAAIAFYRQRGFVPRELVLWRFGSAPSSMYAPADDPSPREASSRPAGEGTWT